MAPSFVKLCQMASNEDRGHFDDILECIGRLNGKLIKTQPCLGVSRKLKPRQSSIKKILKLLYKTEATSVKTYREVCNIALEHDYRIFDLCYRNMQENIQHQDIVSDMLITYQP